MSPTSCRCSTPRRVSGCGALLPRPLLRGWGASAAASPPKGSPPQYSPALRWVTTGFGMGPGGASTLSATDAPHPPSWGGRRPTASSFCATTTRRIAPAERLLAGRPRALHACLTHPPPYGNATYRAAPGRSAGKDRPTPPSCDVASAPLSLARAAPVPPQLPAASLSAPETDRVRGIRPRPLGRLGSSRLPAVHRPPIDPVICRGSYLSRVGMLVLGRDSRLDAFSGSPVRTWLPSGAAVATTGTPAVRPPRSSRTRGSPPQHPLRPWRIETELSHDVLNPARVPLSWANSPTLGTFSGPRMRRADIEVPNPAVDVDSWAGSACYPRGSFYPLSHGPSTRHRGITRPAFRPCSACPPRSQAPLLPLRAPADCHPA